MQQSSEQHLGGRLAVEHQAERHAAAHEGAHEGAHPGPLEYVKIAVILAIITAVEVGVYYMPALGSALVPILLVLSAAKFSMVVLWFMHLKFDSRLFSAVFVGGLLLAAAVLISLIVLFLGGPTEGRPM